MLVRLLYASRVPGTVTPGLLDAIFETSSARNAEWGVTGVLCVCETGNLFMQVLEGSRDAVNRLYANIVRDPRHRDPLLLAYEEISERRFSAWRMGCVVLNRVNRSTIIRFCETGTLDPFAMTAASAWKLLDELVASAAISSRDSR